MIRKIVSQTSIADFRDCPQYFQYKHILGLHPNKEDTKARDFGTAIHAALEKWFLTGDPAQAEDALNAYSPLAGGLDELDFLKAKAQLGGYFVRYENPTKEFEVHKVEKEFAIPIAGTGYDFRGKIDVILRDKRTGRWQLWDHKTASRVDGDYILKRWMDLQLNAYAIGSLEALGITVEDFVYDVLSKPEIRLKKNETPVEYYGRCVELCRDPDMYLRQVFVKEEMRVDETRRQIAGWLGQIMLAEQTGFYGENTGSCFKFNKQCPYWELCVSGKSPIVMQGYHTEALHPELTVDLESGGVE